MLQSLLDIDTRIAALTGSQSFTDAAELLSAHWQDFLSENPDELRERILALPDEVWSSSPHLLLALGASHRFGRSVNLFGAFPYLDAADALIAHDTACPPELRVHALLARAATERSLGRLSDAHALALDAEGLLEAIGIPLPRRIALQSLVLLELGISLALMCDLDGAELRLRNGFALWTGRPTSLVMEALGHLALVEYFSAGAGAPRSRIAAARSFTGGTALLGTASAAPLILVECLLAIDDGRIEDAERARDELRSVAAGTPYELLLLHVEAVIRGIRVGLLEQLEALQEIQIALHHWQAPSLIHYLHDTARIEALIQLGAISAARDAVSVAPDPPSDTHHALCAARLAARLDLHTGDFDAVLATTASCRVLGDGHAPRSLAYVDTLRAAAHAGLGDVGTAAACVDRALFTAARTGWRRHLSTLPHDRLGSMLDAARERPQTAEVTAVLDDLMASLVPDLADSIAPLSSRERLILRHIVAGDTRQQMSSELRVSPNTIKTQVRSIYRKLGAANRHEAIDRATKYGIRV